MNLTDLLSVNALLVLFLTTLLWLISVRLKNVSIVDLFWGTGFVLISWLSLLYSDSAESRGIWLAVLCTLWGLRLSLYLTIRNHGKPEDYRYAAMRSRREKTFWFSSLFIVFWLQGGIMWIVSLPLQLGATSSREMQWWNYAGVLIWFIGFVFEAVGDYQLSRFKRSNTGVMDQGLWRFTRHPNYFGNALIWWGMGIVAFEVSHWWILLSPALMTFLLLKVSGVALLEKTLAARSQDYRDYVERTSAFFPLPPRTTVDAQSS